MYSDFFGFKERPFQLVPNPAYLFLSRSHEEAIAHLNYAISHGDGFVEITGEVGTGKTTLCRAFLDELDKDTEVAYIFNPRLDALELLRAINDEFRISARADNAKDLVDALNAFLIKKKSKKKNVILLIDEAQNLDQEVLEQLRLLSNLETDTSKLLQIILVGQPELREKLDAFELRQLRQRITLRWHLTPLSCKETRAYIRHRAFIASRRSDDKFTRSAYRAIYRYSGGIPRLINIACDRAFLTAFGVNRRKVTGRIARSAIKELRARGEERRPVFTKGRVLTALAALSCLALVWIFRFEVRDLFKPGTKETKGTRESASIRESSKKPGAVTQTADQFADMLGRLTNRSSRLTALKAAVSRWQIEPVIDRFLDGIGDDGDFFRLAAGRNHFQVLTVNDSSLDLVKKLNLPAVLEFWPPGAFAPCYLALIKIGADEMILEGGEDEAAVRLAPADIKPYWSGTAHIPWKDFFNCPGTIPGDAPKESVFTLKTVLHDIGFKDIALDHTYDDTARQAVIKIQQKHGIETDGIVGARTKIVIYNEQRELQIPHIRPPDESHESKSRQSKER